MKRLCAGCSQAKKDPVRSNNPAVSPQKISLWIKNNTFFLTAHSANAKI